MNQSSGISKRIISFIFSLSIYFLNGFCRLPKVLKKTLVFFLLSWFFSERIDQKYTRDASPDTTKNIIFYIYWHFFQVQITLSKVEPLSVEELENRNIINEW